jgi:hypothetical protein
VTFLFWNLNRKPLLGVLKSIVREHRVDFMVLAENEIPLVGLLEGLNTGEVAKFFPHPHPASHFTFLSLFPPDSVRPVRDTGGVAIRRLVPPIGIEILLVALHLPSKLHQKESDQALHCTRIARYIEEAEHSAGHARTVVFGDFNMNPFEFGIVGAEGFHAVMDRRVAAKGARTVQDEERRFFYNPMWSYLGDSSSGPPGSYYYKGSGQVNYYWNMFDQVLCRPDLLERFSSKHVAVLTEAGSTSLLSDQGVPDRRVGSDHLPLLFRINLQEDLPI